jgi:hypothetical protein
MEQLFAEKLWIIPWFVLALVAFGVAGVYVFVDTSGAATGVRWLILRWAHPVCWLFLALAALAMARITPLPASAAGPLGMIGGVLYLAFVVTMLTGPRG